MVETGTVIFYDAKRNYGFIEPDIGGGDLIFTLIPGEVPVQTGDNVTFERKPTPTVTPVGPTAWRVRLAGFINAETEAETAIT